MNNTFLKDINDIQAELNEIYRELIVLKRDLNYQYKVTKDKTDIIKVCHIKTMNSVECIEDHMNDLTSTISGLSFELLYSDED